VTRGKVGDMSMPKRERQRSWRFLGGVQLKNRRKEGLTPSRDYIDKVTKNNDVTRGGKKEEGNFLFYLRKKK